MLNGYRVIHLPNHPRAMKNSNWDGYVYEHIVIAEKYLGRRISDTEVVHHLNGNREHNRSENLLVLEKSQHGLLHAWIASGAPGLETLRMNWVDSMDSKFIPKNVEELHYCKICGLTLQDRQLLYCCEEHCNLANRVVDRPSAETLVEQIKASSFSAVGRKYGVSDNAIRKWLRAFGIDTKTLSLAAGTPAEGAETSGGV